MAVGLNDNQKRNLLLTFKHIDSLLNDAFHALTSAEVPSPFQRYIPDSLPVQRKVIGDYLSRLRALMVRILDRQGIAIPQPEIGSLWAFKTAILMAEVAVEELEPKYMRGYGDLSEDAAHELKRLTTQMMEVLESVSRYLARGAGQDLQARLELLEKTTQEIEWAKVLEQVITAHGLTELRPSLDVVVDRLESRTFEIGVFGRVSSGKSSLLNYLLRMDILPVGVTPVTAIPTRVEFGAHSLAKIWFAEADPITAGLDELDRYVTEQGNPNNEKHVTRIQIELPAEILKEGVTFVDTPGLGSLEQYGEMESLAYLPRCDLGMVLADVSTTPIQEVAPLLNALRQAGAEIMVLLTKADMLSPEERMVSVKYVADGLRTNLGFDVPVYIVSVKGPDAKLCDRWVETVLAFCIRDHQKLALLSLRRKVGLLREATIVALRRRLDKRSTVGGDLAEQWAAVEPALNEAVAGLESAMRVRTESPGLYEEILDITAEEIVDAWRRNGTRQIDAAARLIACGSKQAGHLATEVVKSLTMLRENLISVLQGTATALDSDPEDASEIPEPSGMPLLDLSGCLPDLPLRKPRMVLLFRKPACRIIRTRLSSKFGPQLTRLLDKYIKRLNQWRSEVLTQMRRSFTAKADFYRVRFEKIPENLDLEAIENDLKRLESPQADFQQARWQIKDAV